MRTIERNYRKNPHTANFLMKFHQAAYGLASDVTPDDLLDLVDPAVVPDHRSDAQKNYMEQLIVTITELNTEDGRKARTYTDGMTQNGKWTAGRGGNASAWITRLIAKKQALRAAAPAAPVELEDGIYELNGEIIRVVHAIHGSGRQYGKRLVAPAEPGENGSWVRVPGVIAQLRPEMKLDLAAAERFGAIYGCCVRCGRALTKESSIAQAMGDKCAGSF